MKCAVLLGVLCVGVLSSSAWTAEMRFVKHAGRLAYGLEIRPPWEDGGKLVINFPEHLERWPGTQGILRHNDKEPRGHWEVSADGLSATLDVESSTMPGVWVKGTGRAAGADRAELTMRIENRSQNRLPGIRPLYCFHYRHLTGFPQWIDNFQHAYVVMGGKPVALADIATARDDADVKGAYVRGCDQHDSDDFPRGRGGLIDKELDAALIAVTALEGPRKLVIAWPPGKSILSNAAIPCAHADPYYGAIAPGESRQATGLVIFTQEALEGVVIELIKAGVGAPPGGTPTEAEGAQP